MAHKDDDRSILMSSILKETQQKNQSYNVHYAQAPDDELRELKGLNTQDNELNANRRDLINELLWW